MHHAMHMIAARHNQMSPLVVSPIIISPAIVSPGIESVRIQYIYLQNHEIGQDRRVKLDDGN